MRHLLAKPGAQARSSTSRSLSVICSGASIVTRRTTSRVDVEKLVLSVKRDCAAVGQGLTSAQTSLLYASALDSRLRPVPTQGRQAPCSPNWLCPSQTLTCVYNSALVGTSEPSSQTVKTILLGGSHSRAPRCGLGKKSAEFFPHASECDCKKRFKGIWTFRHLYQPSLPCPRINFTMAGTHLGRIAAG